MRSKRCRDGNKKEGQITDAEIHDGLTHAHRVALEGSIAALGTQSYHVPVERDSECNLVKDFVLSKDRTLRVFGMPGTGKTLVVTTA
jgi:hypothetical protein